MTDIVQQLRQREGDWLCEKAADDIERLRGERDHHKNIHLGAMEVAAENKRLHAENYRVGWALEEIVQSADLDDSHGPVPNRNYYCISTHLIDSARDALKAGCATLGLKVGAISWTLISEAADEIERLRAIADTTDIMTAQAIKRQNAEIERLTAALQAINDLCKTDPANPFLADSMDRIALTALSIHKPAKQLPVDGFMGDEWDEEIPG